MHQLFSIRFNKNRFFADCFSASAGVKYLKEVKHMHDEHIHADAHEAMHAAGIFHDHHDHAHAHEHDMSHTHHGHTHSHENTRAVLNRLSRAIGHLQSVKRMIEEGRDCAEVLVQIAAVRSAIDNTGKVILQDHLKHCIVDAAREGDQQAIDDLCKAIEKYMK